MQAAELGLRWIYNASDQTVAYERALGAELGPLAPPDVPRELRGFYENLMDPMKRTDFGGFCYDGGERPWGTRGNHGID